MLTSGPDIDPLAAALFNFYTLDEKRINQIAPADLEKSVKRINALLVVGPLGAGPIATTIQTFRKVAKKPPSLPDLTEAEAIGARDPVYEKIDLPKGSFGGSPPAPS